jgi:hypothetical protein
MIGHQTPHPHDGGARPARPREPPTRYATQRPHRRDMLLAVTSRVFNEHCFVPIRCSKPSRAFGATSPGPTAAEPKKGMSEHGEESMCYIHGHSRAWRVVYILSRGYGVPLQLTRWRGSCRAIWIHCSGSSRRASRPSRYVLFLSTDTLKATRHVLLPCGPILHQVAVLLLSSSLEGGSPGIVPVVP